MDVEDWLSRAGGGRAAVRGGKGGRNLIAISL